MHEQDENIFTPFLKNSGAVILDGALATELELLGHDLRNPFWSSKLLHTDPQAILAVHNAYLSAGADCLTTASYQISFQGGKVLGLSATEVKAMLTKSVELTQQAIDLHVRSQDFMRPLVAASLGPYAGYLCDGSEYSGHYDISIKQLMDFHEIRWESMMATTASLVAFETIPNMYEAEAVRRLAENFPEKPFWISFCCRDRKRLSDGNLVAEAATLFQDLPHLAAVGINCTDPAYLSSLLSELHKAMPSHYLVAYPNSGERYDAVNRQWMTAGSDDSLQRLAVTWQKRGAAILGGCCRTGPKEIAQIRKIFPRHERLDV